MKKSTNNLKALRKARGFKSLKLLANKTGIPSSTLGAIEVGTRSLTPHFRKIIEEVLGVEIVESFTSDSEPMISNEGTVPYRIRRVIWMDSDNATLEKLLHEYSQEKDWGAVKEITTELLNRKITDKLKEKLK